MGDIAFLEPGEIIPCDDVFVGGHNVKCDESTTTGQSNAIKKMSFEDCMERFGEGNPDLAHTCCSLTSGSKVLDGEGMYVIVAVGTKSFKGRIMMGML